MHFLSQICGLLLGVEDTEHVTKKHRLTNLLFSLFPCSFVLLLSIGLRPLCLLHQVRADLIQSIRCIKNTYLVSHPS